MTGRRQIHLVALLALGLAIIWAAPSPATTAQTATATTLTWQDLVPTSVDALLDPFEHLSDDQFFDLQTLARLSAMGLVVAREVHTPEGAEIKEVNAQTVGALDGQLVRLPGFVLPLTDNGAAGDEFLLAPYVGACIYTPPPPPNQMVLVVPAGGYKAENLFEPVWVTGRLTATATRRDLFLVDGSRTLDIGYHLATGAITAYDP